MINNQLFVKNLTVIDCSYLDIDHGLRGMSWQVDINLFGNLDNQGMIFDFGLVKKLLKQHIDNQFDHKFLIPANASGLTLTENDNQAAIYWQKSNWGSISHQSPKQAITILPTGIISSEILARQLEKSSMAILPSNVGKIQIQLIPELIDGPCFQYSHGLKKHLGACQRIAHGHRSRLEIYRDNVLDQELTKKWCDSWKNSYIATREDLKEEHVIDGILHYYFSYSAQEGDFSLTLPQSCCYLLDSESTIEHIAQHLLEKVQLDGPDHQWDINVFEGIGKGAIASNHPSF